MTSVKLWSCCWLLCMLNVFAFPMCVSLLKYKVQENAI
jgi:hypothetical protein